MAVAKVAVVIIALGATAAALLVNRQQRVDVAAEMARSQLRMEEHRRTIARLQAAVAEAVRPAELRVAVGNMPLEWQPIPYRFDPFQKATINDPRKTRVVKSETGRNGQ